MVGSSASSTLAYARKMAIRSHPSLARLACCWPGLAGRMLPLPTVRARWVHGKALGTAPHRIHDTQVRANLAPLRSSVPAAIAWTFMLVRLGVRAEAGLPVRRQVRP